ncbi:hypothetical protein PYCCODRAFT_1420738 [Trametes coccinea BRFM310]|uniref:Fungal-type protein kinase domain-containing protein n=1 Tax=Trametes coccinea (strain BRFM310) TaxID=1353009 RepID=A0A1Y2I9T6_TRAC3|nr:hypothetical protein PYCCODRAFT_1420738 [Trametes coccinea BRFM310]
MSSVKDSYVDCGRRFDEVELLCRVHQHGFLPAVVHHTSAEDVKNGDDTIELSKKNVILTRKKHRIVLAEVGRDLTLADTVNDLLMAIYDTLEVHRMLARDRQILQRDMSVYNILMYPVSAPLSDGLWIEDTPPLIDDVLQGELRSPEQRRARCLIIDLDNAAFLGGAKADAILEELRCRTGTPTYIARSVASGALYTAKGNLSWSEKMPELSGLAKERYIKLHGVDRHDRYTDTLETVHGGVPPRENQLDTSRRAKTMRVHHRWEYDAESVFWTMYAALLRVVPKATPQENKESQRRLYDNWQVLSGHTIPNWPQTHDTRDPLLEDDVDDLASCFLPAMEPLAQLVSEIALHVYPAYPAMTPPPPLDDHLHETMQRLILDYLVKHRDDPIPLVPGRLRPVSMRNVPIVNRGTGGVAIQDQAARSQKRARDPSDGVQMARRLVRASESRSDDPAGLGEGGFEGGWEMREVNPE